MTTTSTSAAAAAAVMTIGGLARRGGVSVKALRRLEGMGLVYTLVAARRATGGSTRRPCGASR
jgi:hypothetical protein